jgi:hypothetical protein
MTSFFSVYALAWDDLSSPLSQQINSIRWCHRQGFGPVPLHVTILKEDYGCIHQSNFCRSFSSNVDFVRGN